MLPNWTVCAIQFDTQYQNQEENIRRMEKKIRAAAKKKLDLIVLPELWTSGYSVEIFHNIQKFAQTESGASVSMLKKLAKEYGVYIAGGSMVEQRGDRCYNTCFLIDREGNVAGRYSKIHLYSAMDEDMALTSGEEMPVFQTDFGKIAIMTCYDIRFVEQSRTYALKGAQAIVVVSNWAKPKLNHWRVMLQARAIENQLAVVACNRVGQAAGCVYFGHSMIIDPWGEIIGEAGEGEEILKGVIEGDRLQAVRQIIPMYKDRKTHCYEDVLLKPYDGEVNHV